MTNDELNKQEESHEVTTLPTRQASVTVLDQVDELKEAGPGLQRRESLENTRNFYGGRPTSPLGSSVYRQLSTASRFANSKNRARSNSHASANSFSAGANSDTMSPKSPVRSPVPLPTPKGFLSPKKPAAAVRLERIRGGQAFTSARSRIDEGESRADGSEVLSDRLSQDGYTYEPSIASNFRHRREFSQGTLSSEPPHSFHAALTNAGSEMTEVPHISSPTSPNMGPGNIIQESWDRSLRHSVTTVSTPPQRLQTLGLSSDHLMNLDAEKNEKIHDNIPSRSTFEHIRTEHHVEMKAKRQRRYHAFENPLSRFICRGYVLIGGDTWYSMGLVMALILGISGVWLGTTGAWMWVHGKEYGLAKGAGVAITIIFVYLFALTFSSFLVTALREPGIIPRKLDLDPPMTKVDDYWEPYPRELVVNDGRVTVKYCETCETYRPPRCSHCRLCGNCVDGIDHHCSYLHTCIGKRNYFSFIVLLMTAGITDIYIMIFSAIHLLLICHHENVSFKKAIQNSPGSAVSFLLGVLAFVPILFLLQYHIRLLFFNLTTLEQIRANTSNSLFAIPKRPDNPFARSSTWKNIVYASFGRPQFPSWINASGWENIDKREINPALRD
ncbi:uncharacterized protein L203_103559 [Cryptococcus depauperatus CBS 7841]|uniref:Palmitoyltransferase n=1 Tax=Cryptococcus depauperatus CBS 7841 TaxID=1295531 RepID=A0A1E3IJV5_9TREE|nr:hypothetical protein L203_02844 [Cryptococcus depauperatus CBS 7841]